jgi:hypothetical protein
MRLYGSVISCVVLTFVCLGVTRLVHPSGPHACITQAVRVASGAGGAADLPKPPEKLVTIADAPTSTGFPDQGSQAKNRPFFDDFSWRFFTTTRHKARN